MKRLAIAITLGWAAPAAAGPWCGGGVEWAPQVVTTLPPRAHLVVFTERRRDGDDDHGLARPKVTATLDGKPLRLATRLVKTDRYMFLELTVPRARTGTLRLRATGDRARDVPMDPAFVIDPAWVGPEAVHGTIARYREAEVYRPAGEGVAILVEAPVTTFTVRWRRDQAEAWRTLELPPSYQGRTPQVRLGQQRCGADNIPLGLLAQGVLVEVDAHLVDGRTLPVADLPSPLVLPPPPAAP